MNESMTLLARGNPKVYVLIRTDYEGNDAVVAVYATLASVEAAKTALQSQKGIWTVDIEEHDLTP